MKTTGAARDVMISNLITLVPETRTVDAVRQLVEHDITGAPVIDATRRFQGSFSEKSCMGVLTHAMRSTGNGGLKAEDVMQTRLVALDGDSDVFEAIARLVHYRVSGAPVIAKNGEFRGVFSEKDSMSVVIASAYDQVPTSEVAAFMNPDVHRVVTRDTDLASLITIFQTTHYRRLVVLDQQRVIGLISRRDVLRAAWPFLERVAAEQSAAELQDGAGFPERFALAPAAAYMDRNARTILEDLDVLSIAQIFLNTNFRRLAVVRDGELVGLVSRRNLLAYVLNSLAVRQTTPHHPLYVSSVIDPDASIPIE